MAFALAQLSLGAASRECERRAAATGAPDRARVYSSTLVRKPFCEQWRVVALALAGTPGRMPHTPFANVRDLALGFAP